jgi:hypothetical protein
MVLLCPRLDSGDQSPLAWPEFETKCSSGWNGVAVEFMHRWHYRRINLNDVPRKTDDIDLLNDVGREGWELLAITSNNFAYLKRQLHDPAPEPAARRKTARNSNT